MTQYTTRQQATKALAAQGYSVHVGEGASGDGPWGSRVYFKRPGEYPDNDYQHSASISKVGRVWLISIFA